MGKFFKTNIDRRGRIARIIWGLLVIGGGIVLVRSHAWAGGLLIAAGLFSFFEAARGWCVMRACGIKTKL
jgi:uncharacterized membrane protein